MTQRIAPAEIQWRDGQPYSLGFDDVYFSSDNGLLETEHVFLQGNDLLHRWQVLQTPMFTIAETGFGTGLNFLCAAQLWLATAPTHATLHFISVEKHPLNLTDITQALNLWPELSAVSTPFLQHYAQLLNGAASVWLYDKRIQLRLLIGDASACLEQLAPSKASTQGKPIIDAWFLDGFSPAKNPEMWQAAMFAQMATLSRTATITTANTVSNGATTFATFSSAGIVRRGLMAAGFSVSKKAGFAKKREMIHGQFIGNGHDA
jgi:tRNA U34 5-methylaminomethyl-2-thiouridine-forming methyltransferase MnmC